MEGQQGEAPVRHRPKTTMVDQQNMTKANRPLVPFKKKKDKCEDFVASILKENPGPACLRESRSAALDLVRSTSGARSPRRADDSTPVGGNKDKQRAAERRRRSPRRTTEALSISGRPNHATATKSLSMGNHCGASGFHPSRSHRDCLFRWVCGRRSGRGACVAPLQASQSRFYGSLGNEARRAM